MIEYLTEPRKIGNNQGYILERNALGKVTHYCNGIGYEEFREYNEDGFEIHFTNSRGLTIDFDVNKQGQILHLKRSDGVEQWRTYDDKGRFAHTEDTLGNKRDYNYKPM